MKSSDSAVRSPDISSNLAGQTGGHEVFPTACGDGAYTALNPAASTLHSHLQHHNHRQLRLFVLKKRKYELKSLKNIIQEIKNLLNTINF